MSLTDKQQSFLQFLTRQADTSGRIPSFRKLEAALQLSHGAVQHHIVKLAEAGHLLKKGQSYHLTQLMNRVPILGTIAASGLTLHYRDRFSDELASYLDISLFSRLSRYKIEDLFALRVSGDSMRDAFIQDRDVIVMRKDELRELSDGTIVAIEVDGETTLKYLYWQSSKRIKLKPANPSYHPITVDLSQHSTQLLGVYTGVMVRGFDYS